MRPGSIITSGRTTRMKVGLVYHPIYLQHDTGEHPENARRLEAVTAHLEQIKPQLTMVEPRAAAASEIALVHDNRHIAHIKEVAERGGGRLTMDTAASADSYQAALYAAGGVIRAGEAVLSGETDSAFALVRPPGHHATRDQAMGFCLFNNIAIAAKYLLTEYELERIAIIDFDVHHGNGTQDAFYDNPRVLYVSTHQYPHYPGTGHIQETGVGAGEGATVNIPLPAGCGDTEYPAVFRQIVVPAARRFEPQFILVSAGYDLHWADELAMMQVSVAGFSQMVKIIKGLADELCNGRLVFSLEGGYHLQALAYSIRATLDVLLGNTSTEDPLGASPYRLEMPDITPLAQAIRKIHNLS